VQRPHPQATSIHPLATPIETSPSTKSGSVLYTQRIHYVFILQRNTIHNLFINN
jgi:hypothetical protein